MAASQIVKHFTDGVLVAKDGTATPVSLTLSFTLGDLTISGLNQARRATNAYEARGALTSLRKGAKAFPTGSFSCQIADFSDATERTALDFFLKQNSYSANKSTTEAIGDVYTVDLVLTVEGTDLGDAADHVITLEDCDCSLDLAEGEPTTLSVSFTCYGTLSMT